MKALLLASAIALVPFAAHATVQVIAFGQNSGSNTVTATNDALDTTTTLSIVDAQVGITQILGGIPVTADLDLTATSTDAVQGVGAALLQHYSGSFSITSGPGGSGIDYLSGTFTDAAFGLATGSQLSVNVSNPPDTLSLTSSVIPLAELAAPNSITFALSNVTATAPLTGGLQQLGTTIGAFTASVAGDADASAVPEPASLALFGVSLLGLGMLRAKRNSA